MEDCIGLDCAWCLAQDCPRERKSCDKMEALQIRLNELTSPVYVKDCPFRVFNGEGIGCRIYEDQSCEEPDFINCLFRENLRLKEKISVLEQQVQSLINKGELNAG